MEQPTYGKSKNEIIYEGETFSIIPDELFCSGKLLSHSEIRLWLILRKYSKDKNSFGTEPSFLSQEKMAKFMGESRLSTTRHLKKMKEKGLIRVKRLGLTRTNRIYLIDPFEWLKNQAPRLEVSKMNIKKYQK